jgi:hypothetical protein
MSNPFLNNRGLTPYDKIQLGGTVLPGIVKDINLSTNFEYEVPKKTNTSGGQVVYKGKELRRMSLILTLYSASDWDEWDAIYNVNGEWGKIIDGKEMFPLAITHPLANSAGINTVVISSVQPSQPDLVNGMSILIELVEWSEQTDATQTKNIRKNQNVDNRRDNPNRRSAFLDPN